MRHAPTVMIALAGAACLGSIASMAIPTRMAMATQQSRGMSGADRAFADAPAYYEEPGPQDLVPASYQTASDMGWNDTGAWRAYRSSWLEPMPAAAGRPVPSTADDQGAANMVATSGNSPAADAPPDITETPQDAPSVAQGAQAEPPEEQTPQQVAVIEVPAPPQ